jgi:uncharacterized protein YjbI with pentapeptide repeats
VTTAWRSVGDRRLRRPAGGRDEATGLGDDLVIGASLDGLDLAGSRREPLSLVDSVLRRCDVSAAVWQAVTLRQVEVLDCRARGLRLSVDLAQDVYLSGCRFDQATLRIERVRGLVVFDGCVFTDAVVGGDLSSVVFTDCGFDEAEFAATRAAGCDLRSSRLAGARGLLTLRGARITGDQSVAIAARLAAESGFLVED